MAFTTEDGTGVAGANSYVDVAFMDNYFSERNIAAWSGTNPEKQAWAIRATDYLEGRFGSRFLGTPATETQGLHFPVAGETTVPTALKRACCEYALRAKTAPLAPDPAVDSTGLTVVTTVKKVGPLEKHFEAVGSHQPAPFRAYPAADMLLAGLLTPTVNRTIR